MGYEEQVEGVREKEEGVRMTERGRKREKEEIQKCRMVGKSKTFE